MVRINNYNEICFCNIQLSKISWFYFIPPKNFDELWYRLSLLDILINYKTIKSNFKLPSNNRFLNIYKNESRTQGNFRFEICTSMTKGPIYGMCVDEKTGLKKETEDLR